MVQKKSNKIDVLILTLSTLGIIAVINFFAYSIFFRIDLTKNKDYSISQVSINTATNLDDIINIKLYISENLPSQYITLKQDIKDILDDYANYSNKVKYKIINPTNDEKIKEELYFLGIPELQFNVLEKDKYQITNGFIGIAIHYGENTEVIPVIESTFNLEYDLTLAIKKVTSKTLPTVGIINDSINTTRIANEKLAQFYKIQSIDLSDSENIENILSEISTLILSDINSDLPKKTLESLDNFIVSGNSLIILSNGVNIGNNLEGFPNNNNLHELIQKYGININTNLVLDNQSGLTSFSQGFVSFMLNYPLWPKITKDGFNQDHTAVAKLESLVLPWASSLNIIEQNIDSETIISPLLKTTKNAWLQEENFDLNPRSSSLSIPSNKPNQYILAYSLSGKIKSAYSDNTTSKAKIIVIGDADFISDKYLRQNPENLLFFQNIVDYLSIDEDLIKIRSKGVTSRPIKEINDNKRHFIRYVNIFGTTFAVICFGMLRYYSRRKKYN